LRRRSRTSRSHNAGQSPHTSTCKPWRLPSFHYFQDSATAAASNDTSKAPRDEPLRRSVSAIAGTLTLVNAAVVAVSSALT
jgi:hypothetical protein